MISYEPYKVDSQIPGVPSAPSLEAALKGSDFLVLLVAHTPSRISPPKQVAALTKARLVVDTVNIWDSDPLGTGWIYSFTALAWACRMTNTTVTADFHACMPTLEESI